MTEGTIGRTRGRQERRQEGKTGVGRRDRRWTGPDIYSTRSMLARKNVGED